jgi:hypothetical protein
MVVRVTALSLVGRAVEILHICTSAYHGEMISHWSGLSGPLEMAHIRREDRLPPPLEGSWPGE